MAAPRPVYDFPKLLREYNELPDSAFVRTSMFAAARGCSVSRVEQERCAGRSPIPFRKEGNRALYRKADVERYLSDPSIYQGGPAFNSAPEPDQSQIAA